MWPDAHTVLFGSNWNANVILSTIYKLGLMLLLFCSGLEIRSSFSRPERRAATWITATGTLLPFGIALLAGSMFDLKSFHGTAPAGPALDTAFNLVLAVALAVTSIPVISRIFLDLGIIDTPFARIVLTAAVIEDVLLYVVLSVALSFVTAKDAAIHSFGLMGQLGIEPGSNRALAWHVGSHARVLRAGADGGPPPLRGREPLPQRPGSSREPRRLPADLPPDCDAPRDGPGRERDVRCVRRGHPRRQHCRRAGGAAPRHPPVLVRVLHPGLLRDGRASGSISCATFPSSSSWRSSRVACAIKAASVYAGARLAGQSGRGSVNLAVTMNARGGPGIVLASLALDAGIIDARLHVVFVLLAILTSMMAGAWLQAELRKGRPLLS